MTWNSVGDGRLSSTKMAYSPAATTDSLPFSVEGLILGASTPLAEVIESSDEWLRRRRAAIVAIAAGLA
jgi:hypothetical protein